MREDDRSREQFAEELIDATLPNHRGAEPQDGLEDRVLANLRRQSHAERPVSWNTAPALIAAAIVLAFFAVEHRMRRQAASEPAVPASVADARRDGVDPAAADPRAMAGEVAGDGVKIAKAFAAAPSSSRRRDLALNLNSRREDERAESGLRIEDAQISEIRLDDIVIGNNERQE